jgi:hypothetical protein
MIDLRPLIDRITTIVARHSLGAHGAYRRWLRRNEGGLNPYGAADAANILYTIGRWPDAAERAASVEQLCEMQDARTGFFEEETHHPFHTTAHCIAALELFDAKPRHPLAAMHPLREKAALETFLDRLDWTWNPWGESHRGAGLYAALVLAGEVSLDWQDWYFGWLWNEADPKSGLWRRDRVTAGGEPLLFHHLAGSFHYLFNHEHARRPLRYPERMAATCLRIAETNAFPLGQTVGFAEIDWIYCLSRSVRQCGEHFGRSRDSLRAFAGRYVDYLTSLEWETDERLNDLHQLFGATCALAELQQAVPGELRSDPPLRLVLDRRPFI